MGNSYVIFIFLFIRVSLSSARYTKDDKLVLDAVDLIDLIRKDQVSYKHKRSGFGSEDQNEASSTSEEPLYIEAKTEIVSVVSDPLKLRKVWSKWSRWSPCSVTCGTGATIRQRRCAAGRCARGEREVQRRLCTRPPCNFAPAEDSHDWES